MSEVPFPPAGFENQTESGPLSYRKPRSPIRAVLTALTVFTWLFWAGFLVMIILGSVCWSNRNDNPKQVHDLCGSKGGALAMLIIGCIFFPLASCCGLAALNMRTVQGYVDMRKMSKKQQNKQLVSYFTVFWYLIKGSLFLWECGSQFVIYAASSEYAGVIL